MAKFLNGPDLQLITSPPVQVTDLTSPIKNAFESKMELFPGLRQRKFRNQRNPKQFRYFYDAWKKTSNRTNNSIYYEINDWNRFDRNEICIDIQFWKEFDEIRDIIKQKKDNIGQKMPLQPKNQLYVNEKNPDWHRLQYIFSDDTDPEIVAQGLQVLIQETKDVVNEWLKSKKLPHY